MKYIGFGFKIERWEADRGGLGWLGDGSSRSGQTSRVWGKICEFLVGQENMDPWAVETGTWGSQCLCLLRVLPLVSEDPIDLWLVMFMEAEQDSQDTNESTFRMEVFRMKVNILNILLIQTLWKEQKWLSLICCYIPWQIIFCLFLFLQFDGLTVDTISFQQQDSKKLIGGCGQYFILRMEKNKGASDWFNLWVRNFEA